MEDKWDEAVAKFNPDRALTLANFTCRLLIDPEKRAKAKELFQKATGRLVSDDEMDRALMKASLAFVKRSMDED